MHVPLTSLLLEQNGGSINVAFRIHLEALRKHLRSKVVSTALERLNIDQVAAQSNQQLNILFGSNKGT